MAASESDLGDLHALIAQSLADKIADGSATAADYTNAIRLLKDSGISAVSGKGGPIDGLARQFPSFADDSEYVN